MDGVGVIGCYVPRMISPGPCLFLPPTLTSTGGLSSNDLNAGSSTGWGPLLRIAVRDMFLHCVQFCWKKDCVGLFKTALEATRKDWVNNERAGALIV